MNRIISVDLATSPIITKSMDFKNGLAPKRYQIS